MEGRAIVGQRAGTRLALVPANTIAFADWLQGGRRRDRLPDGNSDVPPVAGATPPAAGADALRAGTWLREGRMNCRELEASLHPYIDGELPVDGMAAAEAHVAECRACEGLVRHEREFRALLRRQPRETVPPEFRARITASVRREGLRRAWRPWLLAPAAAAAVAALLVAVLLPVTRPSASLIGELVDKHIAYAQIERPVELASSDRGEIEQWFQQRAALRVVVPDYSPAGIRLIGARLADAHQQKAAYLFYEKGRTLLSVFIVPVGDGDARLTGTPAVFRGQQYLTKDVKGYHTVSWADGRAIFSLVSALDCDAVLECADRLRLERADRNRL
jgi:anti-sigma factor RsiW